ncbi:MAG: DALR domain-containing protein, partial [Terriglobales bacterium]
SAMAGKYLGDEFDINGGGPELIIPHHENEIAQSRAAGRPFARYWVHHALLNMDGEKMAKSLGNVVSVSAAFSQARPVEVRYYLAGPHYRSEIDYTPGALSDAATAYRRLENFVYRAVDRVGAVSIENVKLPDEFAAAMDDDLATPRALGAVHESARVGNQALADGDNAGASEALRQVRVMLDVIGVDPLDAHWSRERSDSVASGRVIDGLVGLMLQQRQAARERKDYAAADAVRDRLAEVGVILEDGASGTRWSLS